ncbi:hypothetical protein QA639_21235 [Bradyrhizobium pachyrhizi]|uniref:hypothetical protein n=1 Tax=Bradyrhizobium pachyrhizi TaxID=280333 RepID=UPI0024B15959|nr:hypothetical protein [Bradyrhizobium pachyrhizi]WFU52234.1 hypothetical protein QA639_21235 [Bradyrhizobium pachyrhizi]
MDPTMGQTAIYGIEQPLTNAPMPAPVTETSVISMSGYLNKADMQADQAAGTEASGLTAEIDNGALPVAETSEVFAAGVSTEEVFAAVTGDPLPAPEAPPAPPKYPVGKVDFNKPFEITKVDDHRAVLTEIVILSVLNDATFPVVIAGYDDNAGERVVLQFDLEGDDINGDWLVENLSTEPQTKFVRLFQNDDREFSVDEELYDTEAAAKRAFDNGDVFGVFAVVLPPRGAALLTQPTVVDGVDEVNEEEEHDEGGDDEVVAEVVEATPPAPPHPDAKWVSGRLVAPGQIVRFHKQHVGTRDVEVIKTRDHSYATLFVRPQDGSNPYWALNKNLRS